MPASPQYSHRSEIRDHVFTTEVNIKHALNGIREKKIEMNF